MSEQFKLGETVSWFTPCPRNKLQAHKGVVVEVVPAGGVPHVSWMASPRNHESYLIEEHHISRKTGLPLPNPEVFWPRVKWLRKMKAERAST
jgi:hypothetical protein